MVKMKQIYRFSSTLSNSKLKSSLCVVGPIATKVSRTIIPDLDPEVMIKNGHKSTGTLGKLELNFKTIIKTSEPKHDDGRVG